MKKVKSKITNKKAQKTKELKNTLKSITKSEDFKNIKSLISTINDSEIKTNQQRRESIAKIYLHCNDLFEESNLDKGRRAYLLLLFPKVKDDDEQNRINQRYRNKYNRALRLLDEQKIPKKFKALVTKIEEIGLQSLFNGKINHGHKEAGKTSLNSSIGRLLKNNTPNKLIRAILKNKTSKKTESNVIICCFDNKLFYTSKTQLIKQLKKESSLKELKNSKN